MRDPKKLSYFSVSDRPKNVLASREFFVNSKGELRVLLRAKHVDPPPGISRAN